MVDAYVVQQTGVTYSALEFRRAQAANFAQAGAISGLTLTAGTSQVTVSAGVAAVRDAQAAPAYYIAEVDTPVTLTVATVASGSRNDILYISVNDTAAAITVAGANGTTGTANVPVGAVYVALASGGTGLPAQYAVLGTVTALPNNLVNATNAGRQQAENASVSGRYLLNDGTGVIAAGTRAGYPSPTGVTDQVANKAYVDVLTTPTSVALTPTSGFGVDTSGGNYAGVMLTRAPDGRVVMSGAIQCTVLYAPAANTPFGAAPIPSNMRPGGVHVYNGSLIETSNRTFRFTVYPSGDIQITGTSYPIAVSQANNGILSGTVHCFEAVWYAGQ